MFQILDWENQHDYNTAVLALDELISAVGEGRGTTLTYYVTITTEGLPVKKGEQPRNA